MTTLGPDSFDRTNNTDVSTGGPLTYTEVNGNWDIINNELRLASLASGTGILRCDDALSTDDNYGQVTYTNASGFTSTSGVGCRFDASTSTGYIWIWRNSQTRYWLCTMVAGTITPLTNGGSSSTGKADNDVLKVAANGSTIKGFVNGVEKVSLTDATITTGKHAAIVSQAAFTQFDDFSAGDLSASGAPFTLTAGAGSFTETGVAVTLTAARKLAAAAGSFSLTGQTAALAGPGAKTLTAEAGSFTLTGNAANFELAVPAGTASYTLTGQTVGLKVGRKIAAAAGSFSLTGQSVTLSRGHGFPAAAGTFSLAGIDLGLAVARKLAASAGSFAMTGRAVTLTWSGAAAASSPGTATLSNTGPSATLSNRP